MANSNQEIIEARLATFIDGELDPAERMEIETHLEQNPQYRKMVEELRMGRELVRGLRRESAPPELAEAFNSQLERSVLLDGGGEQDQPQMRIGAWQHIFAAAAIVFLTVGLAAIVYYELPRPGGMMAIGDTARSPKTNANPFKSGTAQDKGVSAEPAGNYRDQSRPDETQPVAPSVVPDEPTREDRPGKGSGQIASKDAKQQTPAENRGALSATLDEARKTELNQLARNVSEERAVIALVAAESAGNNHAMVLVVRSNDPQQVDKALTDYCRERNIVLQAAPEQTALALNMPNTSAAQQNDPSTLRKAAMGGGREPEPRTAEAARSLQDEQKPADAVAAGVPPGQGQSVAMAHAAGQPKPAASLGQSPRGAPMVPGMAPGKAKSAAVRIDRADAKAPAPTAPQADVSGAHATTQFAIAQEEKQGGKFQERMERMPRERLVYVARRLSRQDAQALNACLARNGEVSQAAIVRQAGENLTLGSAAGGPNQAFGNNGAAHVPSAPLPGGAVTKSDSAKREDDNKRPDGVARPTTEPAADVVVQKGDQLRLRYPPGKDTNERAETVIVKDDGTIELQAIAAAKGKAVLVAGKKLSEVEKALEQTIGDEGAALAGPALAPVKVSILSQDDDNAHGPAAVVKSTVENPTTQAVAVDALKETRSRRSAPFSAASAAPGSPTTRPSGSSAELVDVVIVVQTDPEPALNNNIPAAAPTPATAPTTQPDANAP